MRQAFDLVRASPRSPLGQPVRLERLKGLDDAGVQHASPLLQQTARGHLMGEGMLEGVGGLGKQAVFRRRTLPLGGAPGRGTAPRRACRQ